MKRPPVVLFLFLIVALAVLPGCSFELTLRGRSLHGPYEGFQAQAEADQVVIAQELLKAGVSDADVLVALQARGLKDSEARRILKLAFLVLQKESQ